VLRDQIRALKEAGVGFVRFGDCAKREYVERGRHVAVTFDDGHASNEAAFRFLADEGVTPTAFVVRDWSMRDRLYLSAAALADLRGVCEFGGHGASHRALTTLSASDLAQELAVSRDFASAAAGAEVASMALPGGHGGRRELAAAARAGYALVGNSRPFPHARRGISVNRICINSAHGAEAPLRLVEAGAPHWAMLRARFAASALARRAMGRKFYEALAALAK
jgi:peptidoglycan/xylan/chitin deacetylase (PgdA/CDA1 family)